MRLSGLKKFFSRDTDKKDEKLEIEIKTEERDIEQENRHWSRNAWRKRNVSRH